MTNGCATFALAAGASANRTARTSATSAIAARAHKLDHPRIHGRRYPGATAAHLGARRFVRARAGRNCRVQ
jgi:hypothetical protein